MKGLMLALLGMAMFASAAQAQTGRHVALGVGLGYHKYVDSDFSQKNPGVSLVYRLAWKPGVREGWTLEPKATFDYFKTDVKADVGTVDTHIGKLRSIPVLVGAGPAYRHGRTKVGVAILAGPSFNHFTGDKGTNPVTVKNSVVVRPETSLWYDVSSRLGLHAGVGYVYNRPTAKITSGASTTSEKWKTDHVNFSAGFAIGIF
jgi:opacity protein-like surface antigen